MLLRKFLANQRGYSAVDVVTGMVLLALSMVSLYQVMIPSFALWRNSDERIARQQDVRLAIDRLSRDLHESTLSLGRLRVYNCAGPSTNQNCSALGFATARDSQCGGAFQLTESGEPNWQAVFYVWLDTGTNELRRYCDTSTTLPAVVLPSPLTPFDVVGRHLVLAAFTLQPVGSPNPRSVAIALQEQATTASRPTYRYQTNFYNETVFLPMNTR